MPSHLFDKTFLKKIAALKFLVKKILLTGASGEKNIRQRGGKLEFSEYRDYTLGDEAKYIDWNVFGRTEKLFIKEFTKEESVNVYLVLDLTNSMGPASPINKLDFAKQLSAALGYVALVAGHRFKTIGFSGNTLTTSPEFHREQEIFPLMQFLEPLPARSTTNLSYILQEINKQTSPSASGGKGLIVFISDLMSQSGIDEHSDIPAIHKGFQRFINRGFEVNIIHLLAPSEIEIKLTGWTKLKDAETGKSRTLFINQAVKDNYCQELNKFIEDWKSFCLKHNIRYFHIKTDTPLETTILNFLRKGGLLK